MRLVVHVCLLLGGENIILATHPVRGFSTETLERCELTSGQCEEYHLGVRGQGGWCRGPDGWCKGYHGDLSHCLRVPMHLSVASSVRVPVAVGS